MLVQAEALAQVHVRLEEDSGPASDVAVVACQVHQGSKGLVHHLSWACGELVEVVVEKVAVMRPKMALVFEAWTQDVAKATTAAAVVAMCLEVVAMASRPAAAACWEDLVGAPGAAMKLHDHPGGLLVSETRTDDDHTVHLVIQRAPADL
jgi:hypothetical protein